jgi:hypothetical protein
VAYSVQFILLANLKRQDPASLRSAASAASVSCYPLPLSTIVRVTFFGQP